MTQIPISNPKNPFLGVIPGGLAVGHMIRVLGQMNYSGTHNNRFNINIQKRPSDDTAIHLSIRPSENTIVRNHKVNNYWGAEERIGGCPIQPGQHFDILILAEHGFFKIAVNGSHYCVFPHRLQLAGNGNFIAIDGNCSISFIGQEFDAPIPVTHYPSTTQYAPPPPYTPPTGQYGVSGYSGQSSSTHVHHHHHYHKDPTPALVYPYQEPYKARKKTKKAVKYAAGIGGAVLGLFAVSQVMERGNDFGEI